MYLYERTASSGRGDKSEEKNLTPRRREGQEEEKKFDAEAMN
jgi:hypothetical protein